MRSLYNVGKKLAVLGAASAMVAACWWHPELDRPVVLGNTMDQFNSMDRIAPQNVNVNISYEFEHVSEFHDEETGNDIWIYRGRLEDMKNRYILAAYVPELEDDEIPAGQILTQGRARVTAIDTCAPASGELDEEQAPLFGKVVDEFKAHSGAGSSDLFVRRMIANATEEGGRRLEVTYFVDVSAEGQTCPEVNDFSNEEWNALLNDLRDESTRSFEVIG